MTMKAKTFFKLLAVVAVFVLINCFNFIPNNAVRGGADCIVLALLTVKMIKNYGSKKKKKWQEYKDPHVYIIPMLFLAAIPLVMLIGQPGANFVCWLAALAIGWMVIPKKKNS
jgi:hypothetical protein